MNDKQIKISFIEENIIFNTLTINVYIYNKKTDNENV